MLLVDEVDRADEEFEAFMLEIFAEWQVTIPEIGTIKAVHPPHVILTSNRTRELSDALRRRCLYIWIDYPPYEKEVRIVERKVPGIDARLAREVARFMESLRRVRLAKVPGVAETLDWAQALAALHADHLDETVVSETLGCVLKDADDIKKFRAEVAKTGLAPFISPPSASGRPRARRRRRAVRRAAARAGAARHAHPGARRACGRSTTSTSATASEVYLGLRAVFVVAARGAADLRPLLRRVLACGRPGGVRTSRGSMTPSLAADDGAARDTGGGRPEARGAGARHVG